MTDLTLYIGNKNYSSWSMRPWIAMKAVGLPFKEVLIPFAQADTKAKMLAVSPTGKVPVLHHGHLRVWDSLAICEYVADTFPHLNLWPEEREARAEARSVCAEMHSGFPAMRTALNMNIRRHFSLFHVRVDVMQDVDRILQIWAAMRDKYKAKGEYLFGEFSIADAFFAPVLTRFETYGVQVPPVCRVYMDAMMLHPAMKQWIKEAEEEPYDDAKFEYITVNQ